MVLNGRAPRVLIGDMDVVTRKGMLSVLIEAGADVVEEPDLESVVMRTAQSRPDSVILALTPDGPGTIGSGIRQVAPHAKLILWARDESELRVYDPGAQHPRLVARGGPAAIVQEIALSS